MTLTLAAAGTIQGVAGSASAVTYTVFGDEITAGPTNTFKKLAQGQLAAAAGVLYTVPGSTSAIVKNIILDNTSGGSVTVSLFVDGTTGPTRIGSFPIAAGGNATWGPDGWALHDAAGALVTSSSTSVPTSRLINTTSPITGGGSLAGDLTLAMATNGITYAMQAQAAAFTFVGNATAGTANKTDLTQAQATAMINAATTALKGLMSTADKIKLNALYVDVVAEYGFVGDDSTLNDSAWTTFIAAVPTGSTVYFPPGTYRFANELTINVDKRLHFEGAGAWSSIIKTTSVTANIFNLSIAAWFTTFADLGFATTATKTAGAAIAISAGNNVGIDIRRVAMTGLFIGIDAQGAQSANLSVWDSINYASPPVNGRCFRINGSTINVVIANSTSNCVPNAGAIAGSANIEINQSGAVQVYGCDFIGGVNSCLINANQGGGTSIAACYFTNVFFDQSGGSTVKIAGANTTNRIKFTQCGIAAGIIGGHAFEVAGTGAGAVGTATAMPAGISLVDCDIYYAPGSSTASGIHINGCQDINIQDTRVTGFSGTGGAGIHVIASASNQTRVRANGCRIGPNSNLTINNLVGIQLDAGASALGALTLTDNDIGGNGTAIVDNSTIVSSNSKMINNNVGALAGMSTSLASAAGFALSTTEQVAVILPLPANSAKVGTTFKFTITGTAIITVTTTARLHIGTAGSVADAQIVTTAASAAGVAGGFVVSGLVTIAAVGATGTGQGAILITTGTTTGAPAITATGTFNSTIANFVTVGLLCSAAGHTVRAATLEIVSPS